MRPGIRGRLVVAFILVAGISSGALAAGTWALVRDARLQGSLDLAQVRARSGLALATGITPASDSLSPAGFVQGYEKLGEHAVLVFPRRAAVPSDPRLNPPLPAGLRRLVASGQLGYQRLRIGPDGYLVIGGKVPRSSGELYFFFSEAAIGQYLAQLRTVLLAAWLAVLALAGLTGRLLARRTLEPVARAGAAARSIAGGKLSARLPAAGSDEFGRLAASFNEMADVVQAKIAELSAAQARERQFTSDVAHELRTPLTALVAGASLLREKLARLPADARRPAELLVRDISRLRSLVEELMEISRLDAGQELPALREVDVRSAVQAILATRGWAGSVVFEGEPLLVRTDSRRLERILANLVGNAVEHGGSGVRVTAGRSGPPGPGSSAVIEVSDAGPGIPAEHLAHVFERFYKADPARATPGSGLGLAIAQENARLLGGELTVASPLAAGARFRLVLPGPVLVLGGADGIGHADTGPGGAGPGGTGPRGAVSRS